MAKKVTKKAGLELHLQRHYHDYIDRWMLFVDGENLTMRGQEIASEKKIDLVEGDYYQKDIFIWPEYLFQNEIILNGKSKRPPIRSYYYTSVVGDEDKVNYIKKLLWKIGFNPEVFKKIKGRKSKGVDIALTKDVLSHAFLNNYDLAVLVTGDSDYIPLIEEVKRLGKLVYIVFFSDAKMDPKLVLAADLFEQIHYI